MMTFDEGRTRMPGNNGLSTMPVRPGMTFEDEEMPVRPGMTFEDKKMPYKQSIDPGFDFLRSFIGQNQPNWGGSPGQEVPREAIEKMEQPGAKPPAGFFDDIRRKLGAPGAKEARTPSFDVTPDINSPVIDEDIRRHNLKYGPAPTMDPIIRRNMERMKSRPSLFI